MRMHIALLAAFLAAAAFLSGCIGTGMPQTCTGIEPARLANCVYNNAVMEQNPNYCYNIANIDQRKVCIRDSADPGVKKALSRSLSSESDAIFVETTPSKPAGQVQTQPAPEATGTCGSLAGNSRDSCIATSAIKAQDMSLCASIANSDIRKGCISDVARKTKDLLSCGFLTSMDDINLCKLYAKGDESKG